MEWSWDFNQTMSVVDLFDHVPCLYRLDSHRQNGFTS
jgi:hypothetical protein